MTTVTVEEASANLPELLRRTAEGEEVVITQVVEDGDLAGPGGAGQQAGKETKGDKPGLAETPGAFFLVVRKKYGNPGCRKRRLATCLPLNGSSEMQPPARLSETLICELYDVRLA